MKTDPENYQPSIVIDHLSKVYRGKRGQQVDALVDLSFRVERGEVFGFLGPNGAGKSTTIKTLMGLVSPSSGVALLCGQPVSAVTSRQSVGYLPENPAFYDFLTGREYLSFVAGTFRMSGHDAKLAIDHWLDRLELKDASSRPIRSYSKGMVQRLGLAQALLHDPDVYILDEPMSGLDPMGRALVKNLIRELKERGKTVFFSSHITSDIELVCDRFGVIVAGRLRALLPVEQILEQGVEGYTVQVGGCKAEQLAPFICRAKGDGVLEVDVPRPDFCEFSRRLDAAGGEVRLIETRRKDLESFFLEIVKGQQP